MFLSAVSEHDLAELMRLFRQDVLPAFEATPGCLGIELIRADQPGAGGLIEGGVITRWSSAEEMEAGLESPLVTESQAGVRALLRRQPLRKVYEVIG